MPSDSIAKTRTCRRCPGSSSLSTVFSLSLVLHLSRLLLVAPVRIAACTHRQAMISSLSGWLRRREHETLEELDEILRSESPQPRQAHAEEPRPGATLLLATPPRDAAAGEGVRSEASATASAAPSQPSAWAAASAWLGPGTSACIVGGVAGCCLGGPAGAAVGSKVGLCIGLGAGGVVGAVAALSQTREGEALSRPLAALSQAGEASRSALADAGRYLSSPVSWPPTWAQRKKS